MDRFYMTDKGLNYAAKAADGSRLIFTRGKFGNGTIIQEGVSALTDLVNPLGDMSITNLDVSGDNVTVTTKFSNLADDKILPEFHLHEIGLFAKLQDADGNDDADNPETLVMYAYDTSQSDADRIPAILTEFVITWNCAVSNAENITVEVASTADVTQLDLTNLKTELETEIGKKLDKTQYASTTQAGIIKLYSSGSSNRSGIVVTDEGVAYVSTDSSKGTTRNGAGQVTTASASQDEITAQKNSYKPIVPSTLSYAVQTIGGTLTDLTTTDKTFICIGDKRAENGYRQQHRQFKRNGYNS